MDAEDLDEELCDDCGGKLKHVVISSDADGNRTEEGYVCPECD